MTKEEAVKDIQDMYDAIESFNRHIQDVSMSDIPDLKKELYAVADSNDITKLGPRLKNVFEALERFLLDDSSKTTE